MNINIEIERIANGFIVKHNDEHSKVYYTSLVNIVEQHIMEDIREEDGIHRSHETEGSKYILKFSLESVSKGDE